MRFLSSWQQYLATTDETGIQVHQFATGELRADLGGAPIRISTATGYPWDGAVTVTILETPEDEWTLSLRIPAWCGSATLRTGSGETIAVPADTRRVDERRRWQAGDVLILEMDLPARATEPDRHVDAVRGCIALERGPLVYAIETADLPSGVAVEDVELDPSAPIVPAARPDLGASAIGLTAGAIAHSEAAPDAAIELAAIPYFTWANRTVEAMRVWIPRAEPDET